jgi:hypothetical protein
VEELWENKEEIAADLTVKAKIAVEDLKEGAKGLWDKVVDAFDGDEKKEDTTPTV